MVLAWRWLMSILFVVVNAVMMGLMGIVFLPWAAFSAKGAQKTCWLYTEWVRFTARLLVGITWEVRGEVPQDECLLVSKHQSFLDILIIFNAVPQPRFIMKRELLWTPVIGLYAWRLGCVPVARGRRGAAIKQMMADVQSGRVTPGQLVIYPQGTRVKPGQYKPFKVGSYALYSQLGQEAVPVATNAGLFWPKGTMLRKPGRAVVEFMPRIAQGVPQKEFLARVEAEVEGGSNALMAEAGFTALPDGKEG
ncbi:lysophospholipid acyltransferase family protein [Rhodalgimonas zhirmunskyi]|uniref:1-acyl-sn-glycerol-3-phosphate acyltransferase n=1 Tax=Rhodalgimonas zhirmunskyi TaxID=2964767 RepID=A0AAJ1X6H4_9RHOB|nr:lysophospholipid acyltransferase family protein [Rhodoalgimonas zhirmunskyi]MDQ2094719.1 1-acyl-sn-glycerol-3-phosphate acyltransferase [Rhodoalgimonas zhirmunskyi]